MNLEVMIFILCIEYEISDNVCFYNVICVGKIENEYVIIGMWGINWDVIDFDVFGVYMFLLSNY